MKVVIAFIENNLGELLITQRPLHVDHGGYWEFPGGKVDVDETPLHALERELHEEIGISDIVATPITTLDLNHQFFLYQVTDFDREIRLCENQLDLKWVKIDNVKNFQIPENNFIFLKHYEQFCNSIKHLP